MVHTEGIGFARPRRSGRLWDARRRVQVAGVVRLAIARSKRHRCIFDPEVTMILTDKRSGGGILGLSDHYQRENTLPADWVAKGRFRCFRAYSGRGLVFFWYHLIAEGITNRSPSERRWDQLS